MKRCAATLTRRATRAQKDQLYALLRVRSRLPLCCMRKSGLRFNCIEFALQKNVSFATLAWACHGEIGKTEISDMNIQTLAVWLAELKTRASPWRATEIVSRLVLLVEKGCRIENPVRDWEGGKSIFRIMLEISYRCRNDVARDVFMECIVRLQVQAMGTHTSVSMRPSLRYFLTGHGLPDHLGDMPDHETTGWTTALHESVRMSAYRMVEALVLNEFQVNAIDVKGKTAYSYSRAQLVDPGSRTRTDGTETYEADRIAALLGQNTDSAWSPQVRHQSQSNADVSLPLGWERVSLTDHQSKQALSESARSKTSFYVTLYMDRHFGSITLKSPTFSFFTDQRLALGFRQVHLPGQTYYLDLLRFLQPPSSLSSRSRISETTYSLAWYEQEAVNSDTRRTLNLKQSVQILYRKLQFASEAVYTPLVFVASAAKEVALTIWRGLTYLANCLCSFIKYTILGIALPLSKLVLAFVVPGQPINIYLGCTLGAFVAHKFAWSFGIKLLVNLVGLASLCNLGQTALVVFVGLDRSDQILIDMAKMFINFIVVPFGNIHVEISVRRPSMYQFRSSLIFLQVLVLMFRFNLAGAMIPFILSAISWNFHCVSSSL
jgi:hypothetical protein